MSELMQKCGECGFAFFVTESVGKPVTEEKDGGLEVRVACVPYRAEHCPKCGKEL